MLLMRLIGLIVISIIREILESWGGAAPIAAELPQEKKIGKKN